MIKAIPLLAMGLLFSMVGHAQESSVSDGSAVFQSQCARCHVQAEMEMRLRNDWDGRSAEELFEAIQTTMPADTPGVLDEQAYLDVTAFVMDLGNAQTLTGVVSRQDLSRINVAVGGNDDGEGVDFPWTHFNGDPSATRYSPLEQINADNASELEIAWQWSAANFGPRPESTYVTEPLMVNGTLYATAGATRNVVAIDPTSGQTLWMYRPQESDRFDASPRKNSGKGLAYWTDGDQEVIYYVTPGYYLVALDAETGDPVESFGEDGKLDLHEGLRMSEERDDIDITLTFPPTIIDNVIVVGAAHTVSMRPPYPYNVKGDVRAYDAHTGSHLWTFQTIPEEGEKGYETWQEGSAEYTGNGGVWTAMSFDEELGLVYLPVESATGDRYGGDRPGNNLFTSSVVAVDYRTGEYRWHFQHIRHDIWDYDTPSAPVLADLPDGRKVLAQMTKQSFAYVLDRETGEPIWDMVDTPVPQTDVPGEWTADTQPFPAAPPAYDRQGFGEEDLVDFTPEILERAREAIRPYRTGPLFEPASVTTDENRGTLSLPGTLGGSNWEGSAYDPETGMLYVPSRTDVAVLALVPGGDVSTVDWIQGPARAPTVDGIPIVKPLWGRITAIDLNEGDIEWQVANADTPEDIRNHPLLEGVDVERTGIPTRSGLLLTRSLLFAGEGQGGNPVFRAHDKTTGEIVAEIDLPASQTGTPMTYMIDDQQYIVMAVSGRGTTPSLVALTVPD
ncbi:MAG: PQQ-binding-like beta-propeller repeat protein [Pseudomonadota bacterium]